jgi:predicted permease
MSTLPFDRLAQDLRSAVRGLRRFPVATGVAILSLAAGIGATTVTLMVRDILFHRFPPAYAEPSQLSRVQVGRPDRPIMPLGNAVPAPLYAIWRDTLGDGIAAATQSRGVRDIRAGDRTEAASVRAVSANLFATLGVPLAMGEAPSAAVRDRSGAAPAVLSHRIWRRLFDADPNVLGRVVWIDEQPHTIVGVLPQPFWFSEMGAPIWTALNERTLAADETLEVVVRRPHGTTPAMLDAQLQSGLSQYARQRPAAERDLRLRVSGMEGTPIGHQVAFVLPYVLGTAVLLTLLIACANVAILLIAQWTTREREIAIRASIGASRGRLIRTLLTESVLIAVSAAALGVCMTLMLRAVVLRNAGGGNDDMFFDLSIDPRLFVQVAAVAVMTGILAGIAPAVYETRQLHTNPLRTIASSDRVRQRWRHALVVLEITITVALLVVTAAMIDGYLRARSAQVGYATAPLMSARLDNPSGVPTAAVLDLVTNIPGVAAAALATTVPYAAIGTRERVSSDANGSNAVTAERGAISPTFFTALGVPLRMGRTFTSDDGSRTIIVNEALARRLLPGNDPLGRRIWIGANEYDVIGVVANYSNDLLRPREAEPKVFVPLDALKGPARLHLLIRAESDPAPLTQTVRREIRDASSGTVVASAFTVDQIIRVMGQELLVGTAPLFPLIVIGMLLTTAGIYGTLAFAIARRSRELAIRAAMGATGRDLVRLVSRQSVYLVASGASLGIGLTYGLARLVRASGGAGSIFDPTASAFVAPLVAIVAIGIVATWIPSRRARRIDPAVLLRTP